MTKDLCADCVNHACIMQSGIKREKCEFYKEPCHLDLIIMQVAINAITEYIEERLLHETWIIPKT